jgi:lysophospholipase L1-like esterase
MSSTAYPSHPRFVSKLVRLAFAIAMAVAVFVAEAPNVLAQGLSHLSNSYVTPFPEQNRYRLYVLGDSLGDGIWAGLYRAFKPDGNIDVVKKSRVSTGFVRNDYFDWNKRLATILSTEKVHIAVVMVGANDMQSIRLSKKAKWRRVGSPEWRDIYAKRIDAFIKKLKRSNSAVYWVGLPIMRSVKHNNAMQVMNEVFRERAFINGIKFIDTWNGFADQFGRYSAFGPDLTGRVRRLRAADGVHFTISGYRKLAHFVEREIRRDMRQARTERDIPLAGNEAEQARAIRHLRSAQRQSAAAAKPNTKRSKAASKRKSAAIKPVYANAAVSRSESEIALPSADSTAAGIKLSRPKISQATLAAVSGRYSPQSEVIAGDFVDGVTALASISPISETNLAAAQRRLPLTQRPYYRVLIKGEKLKAKPGRADDFTWPGG